MIGGRHIVDPKARKIYEDNPGQQLTSDVLSDDQAPADSLVAWREGEFKYVSADECLKGKHVGLLFAGACSPMCWSFARSLKKVYKVVAPDCPFEVVYVSGDGSRREFNRFVKEWPWFAVPFRNNEALFARYGVPWDVRSWPRFVLVSPDDQVTFEDVSDVVRKSVQDKKLQALAYLLASTHTDINAKGRFQTLFGFKYH